MWTRPPDPAARWTTTCGFCLPFQRTLTPPVRSGLLCLHAFGFFKRRPLLQSRPERWVWVRAWSPLITVYRRCWVRCSAPIPVDHQPLPSNRRLSAPREPRSASWTYLRRFAPESVISQEKWTVCCLKKCGCILVLATISPLWVSASAWNASAATRLNRRGFLTRWRRRSSSLIGRAEWLRTVGWWRFMHGQSVASFFSWTETSFVRFTRKL